MEYRDYETDEIISREQYIANGLGRGELIVREDCGCVVIQDRTAEAYIVYCPKHESAPYLYEALKEIMERFNGGVRFPLQASCDKANKALAEVEK